MVKEDDDALCAAQNRHMEHPLRQAFDRCEGVYLAKGEEDGDALTAAYLAGVEAGKELASQQASSK
jgi:hypothetical protein